MAVTTGALVRLNHSIVGAYPEARTGIVVESEPHPVYKIRTHGCRGGTLVVRHEFTVKHARHDGSFISMRGTLPYGRWTSAEDRQVLFNRDYKPIWSRERDRPALVNDPDERIQFDRQQWFFDDGCTPWSDRRSFDRCLQFLREWGVPLPKLTGFSPSLFEA